MVGATLAFGGGWGQRDGVGVGASSGFDPKLRATPSLELGRTAEQVVTVTTADLRTTLNETDGRKESPKSLFDHASLSDLLHCNALPQLLRRPALLVVGPKPS